MEIDVPCSVDPIIFEKYEWVACDGLDEFWERLDAGAK
jgi:hypothetical protein